MRGGSGVRVVLAVGCLVPLACSVSEGSSVSETCHPEAAVAGGPVRVVTSVSPITNIVAVVAAGTPVEVVGIVPEGINSHTYEPTPAAAAALERADVIFLNGLDLEAPTKELALVDAPSGSFVCELGDEILPEAGYLFDFSFPESAGSPNPHLWTNPPMVREFAVVIRDVLTAVDPANASVYAANTTAFSKRIDDLDAAIRQASATLPRSQRLLLTYHDAYAYFARDYDWTVVGAVQPSSFNEPTPREVAALIGQIEATGVRAIFGSEVFPSPVLRQIAEETGVEYVDDLRDDDLPGEPGDSEHSWLALMRFNVATIVESLGGDAAALEALDVAPSAPDAATYAL
jgi:ABC-type Zn uptake system ZnuABC Zn-binding protein ZnuA